MNTIDTYYYKSKKTKGVVEFNLFPSRGIVCNVAQLGYLALFLLLVPQRRLSISIRAIWIPNKKRKILAIFN